METSDSEYFESADEDFESDVEKECQKSQHFSHNQDHKTIEPELCKLKIEEKDEKEKVVDNFENKKELLPDNKLSNLTSPNNVEVCSLSVKKSSIEEKHKDSKLEVTAQNLEKSVETVQLVDNLDCHDNKRENNLCIKIEKEKATETLKDESSPTKLPSELPRIKLKKEPVLVSIKDAQNKYNFNEEIPILETIKSNVAPSKLEEEKEENLWDDEELDWGTEGVKEEAKKNEEQVFENKTSKDSPAKSTCEDSGWDDFDADWESEESSRTINKEVKNSFTRSETKNVKLTNNDKKINNIVPKSDENVWEDDAEWEPVEKPEARSKHQETESGWGGWGNWDVSSILNTATHSVTTFTNQVSHGLSTVLESGIGIPSPEELARTNITKESYHDEENNENIKEEGLDQSPTTPIAFGLGNLVSGVSHLTKFVESTGTKVISGGLDTLEAIGKKTVEVLQEGDPGLKKKKAFLKLESGKPNLSQILREAKEKAEEEHRELEKRYSEVRKTKNYETLFDDHQGLVHLEALEMLSKLCNMKLENLNNSLFGDKLKDMQETLEQVKELCELPDEDEEEKIALKDAKETIENAVVEMKIPISYTKLFSTCEETDTWLSNLNLDFIDDVELHQQAIEAMAQMTALAVEQFHKAGELLLVKEHRSTADEADSLAQITTTVKALIINQAGKFSEKLSSIQNEDKDRINEHITNIFFEAANSGTYIKDAFHLLIPVLQVGAV